MSDMTVMFTWPLFWMVLSTPLCTLTTSSPSIPRTCGGSPLWPWARWFSLFWWIPRPCTWCSLAATSTLLASPRPICITSWLFWCFSPTSTFPPTFWRAERSLRSRSPSLLKLLAFSDFSVHRPMSGASYVDALWCLSVQRVIAIKCASLTHDSSFFLVDDNFQKLIRCQLSREDYWVIIAPQETAMMRRQVFHVPLLCQSNSFNINHFLQCYSSFLFGNNNASPIRCPLTKNLVLSLPPKTPSAGRALR